MRKDAPEEYNSADGNLLKYVQQTSGSSDQLYRKSERKHAEIRQL
jgi:hypothetical protein